MKKHKIGLFGFGCVGQGFAQLLEKNSLLNAEIIKTAIKNPDKKRSKVPGVITYNRHEILDDPEIDIVVELIDDAEAAKEIIIKALQNGKSVVSANKKMIAENLTEIKKAEATSVGRLLYEGAVCGSIPILSTLDNYFYFSPVEAISGIFNGSTNYILTKVIDEKLSYEEALKEAQQNGFAESDPTLDVEGYDPTYKLSILIQKAFGIYVPPSQIFRQGITAITQHDIAFAAENELKIKLVANVERTPKGIKAYVAPGFVAASDSLISVDYEYNAVKIKSKDYEEQLLVGKGAGKLPTGLAVIADVATLLTGGRSLKKEHAEVFSLDQTAELEVYISGSEELANADLPFIRINEKFLGKTKSYFIGITTVSKLRDFQRNNADVSIVVVPENTSQSGLSKQVYHTNLVIEADKV